MAGINAQLVFDSSSRNDEYIELLNTSSKGVASFAQFEALVGDAYELDKGTMEDLWSGQAPGTTFDRVRDWMRQNNIVADLAADDDAANERAQNAITAKMDAAANVPNFKSKIAIIFSQMLKARQRFPNQPVVFHFYDDSKTVLSGLFDFYHEHPGLIPAGVTLQLHQVSLTASRSEATNEVVVTSVACNGFTYRARDADGNRPAPGVDKLGEAAQIVSTSTDTLDINDIGYVQKHIALRTALQFVAAEPEVVERPRSTLDGCEGLFAVVLKELLNLSDCAVAFAAVDEAVDEYLNQRQEAVPDDLAMDDIESHHRRAGGHSYGEKAAACMVLRAAFRLRTPAAFQHILDNHLPALSGGLLGRRLAAAIRELFPADQPRTGLCLFNTPRTVVSRWLQAAQTQAQADEQDQHAAAADAADNGGGGGGSRSASSSFHIG